MESEPRKATRKPRADSLKNRERLLAAAADIFRAGGPQASLEAVAKRAGVGIGTLYRHFPTREELFEAVYRREVEQLVVLAGSLAAREAPVQALRLWLRAGVSMAATKRAMLSALALAIDSASPLYAFSFAHLTGALDALLARAVAAGDLRADVGSDDVLQAMVGLSLMGKGPGWETNTMRLLDIFVDGLCIAPQAGSSRTPD